MLVGCVKDDVGCFKAFRTSFVPKVRSNRKGQLGRKLLDSGDQAGELIAVLQDS